MPADSTPSTGSGSMTAAAHPHRWEALTHPELLTVLPGRDHLLHRLLAAVVHRQAADDRRHGHGHGLPVDSKTRLAGGTSEIPSFCCHTLVFEHAVRSGPPRHPHPRAA